MTPHAEWKPRKSFIIHRPDGDGTVEWEFAPQADSLVSEINAVPLRGCRRDAFGNPIRLDEFPEIPDDVWEEARMKAVDCVFPPSMQRIKNAPPDSE